MPYNQTMEFVQLGPEALRFGEDLLMLRNDQNQPLPEDELDFITRAVVNPELHWDIARHMIIAPGTTFERAVGLTFGNVKAPSTDELRNAVGFGAR